MPTLIEEIDAFRGKHELSESQFGTLAVNDKNLVPDLRAGRDLRMSTLDKIKVFMATYQPEPKADAA